MSIQNNTIRTSSPGFARAIASHEKLFETLCNKLEMFVDEASDSDRRIIGEFMGAGAGDGVVETAGGEYNEAGTGSWGQLGYGAGFPVANA